MLVKSWREWDKDPMLKTLFTRFDFVIGIALVVVVAGGSGVT